MLTRYRRTTPSYDTLARDPFVNFVDRFFNEVAWPTAGGVENGGDRGWIPAMDIVENEDAFVATADLPGLTKDDIDISLEDGALSISGERKIQHTEGDGNKGFRRLERSYGAFHRSFTLPQGVDVEKVEAKFADGVLSLTLPKAETARSRKISIS